MRAIHDSAAQQCGLDILLSNKGHKRLRRDEIFHGVTEEQRYKNILAALPQTVSSDMPPEMQSLVELKSIIKEKEMQLAMISDSKTMKEIMQARQLLRVQYKNLVDDNGIAEVMEYLKKQKAMPLQSASAARNRKPQARIPAMSK